MWSNRENELEPGFEKLRLERRARLRCKVLGWGMIAAVIGALLCSRASFAQNPEHIGTAADGVATQAGASSSAQTVTSNPHDISGIWRVNQKAGEMLSKEVPPMTPWAQPRYDAAKPGIGPRSQSQGNDPIMACNPPGFPRILLFNAYPLEIIQLPDRVLQFFDFFYTYRTIWTDGRKLPKDPVARWYGYSVGRWEGNTFVVDSSGFDDRSWLDEDGHPHSSEMQIEERYQRTGPDTITLEMTLTDPKAYTKPWVSEVKTLKRDARVEMLEDLCAPADEERYKKEMREPAATPPGQQP